MLRAIQDARQRAGDQGIEPRPAVLETAILAVGPVPQRPAILDVDGQAGFPPGLESAREGTVPGAIVVARNVLEWRCAPDGDQRDPRLSDPAGRVIVMCDSGYQSSLAAANLRELGLRRAADLAGGFQAWREAGLPVDV